VEVEISKPSRVELKCCQHVIAEGFDVILATPERDFENWFRDTNVLPATSFLACCQGDTCCILSQTRGQTSLVFSEINRKSCFFLLSNKPVHVHVHVGIQKVLVVDKLGGNKLLFYFAILWMRMCDKFTLFNCFCRHTNFFQEIR
jgi:hypothetical protein